MQRRKFLKTGVGVALAGAAPLKTLFAQTNQQVAGQKDSGDKELDKLQQIAQKYGGEFGPITAQRKEG